MIIKYWKAPSYEELQPRESAVSSHFPVYDRLTDTLVQAAAHPEYPVAHVMATCAGYSYGEGYAVAMIMARMGLEDNSVVMMSEHMDAMFISTTAFLIQSADGRVVVLSYRGADPAVFNLWLTDADLTPANIDIRFPGANGPFAVHDGMYRSVRATRSEVVAHLDSALRGYSVLLEGGDAMPDSMESLYITGHGSGGAMAALMAVMLVTEAPYAEIARTLRAVYTFGQPMVGSPAFAKVADQVLGEKIIRFVHRRDVVARLPPKASGSFAHFGAEYRYRGLWPWRRSARPSKQTGSLGLTLVGLVDVAAVVIPPLAFVARQLRAFRTIRSRNSLDDSSPRHYVSRLNPPGVPGEFGDFVV
jgi:Lipase (class 3)